MIQINEIINSFYDEIESRKYISNSEYLTIKEKYEYLYKNIRKNIFYIIKYRKFLKKYRNLNKDILLHNDNYIEEKIKKDSKLLDNVKGFPLDYEQKKAIYTDEDNTLVIAGAGSGKSLTIIGKIRYLIEEKNVKESEILCISFTNASMNSLKQSLIENYNYKVDVLTFHKLSLNILSYNDNYSITSSDLLEYLIEEIFHSFINVQNKSMYIYLKKNITTFIHLFKSNGYTVDKFNCIENDISKEKNKYLKSRNLILINIIKYFYYLYELELRSENKIDFDDMILKATNSVKENGIYINYKYIIIDEYQDTSYLRYNLINEIRKCTGAKILAVGDDFQSIYRFSGCNLDIFLNFEKYYGYTKKIKIQNTYRNSKELINVAGNFIMKNPKQIRKKLNSNKSNKKPIKIFYYSDIKRDIVKLIKKIYNSSKNPILIIGRNNFDLNEILSSKLYVEGDKLLLKNSNINLKYLTVHKSKGLEEENVILINLTDQKFGFPSKVTNDYIMKYVLNEENFYPYEEERRLFYVALTRTKNNVYLFINKSNKSIFVREIENNSNQYIEYIK